MNRIATLCLGLAGFLLPGAAHAACPPIPFVFAQGAPFNAPQVNANFTSLRDCYSASIGPSVTIPTAVDHPVIWKNTTGTSVGDPGTTWGYGGTINLTPVPGSLNRGLGTAQTPAGVVSAADTFLNQFSITTDKITAANGDPRVHGGGVIYDCCDAIATNATRFALTGLMKITGQASAASTSNQYAGVFGFAYTEIAAPVGGSFLAGMNANVLIQNTGWDEAVGIEVDVTTNEVVARKSGVKIVQASTDDNQGSATDGAIYMANQAGAIGWANVLLMDLAQNPLNANACIICTSGGAAPTIAKGIDLSGFTITGNAFAGPASFTVNGAGNMTINSVISVPSGNDFEVQQPALGALFRAEGVGPTVNANHIYVVSKAAGTSPIIGAEGTDTNIDMVLQPQGTGVLRTGYATTAATVAATFSADRRLQVKDSTGTVYYIPLMATAW